MRILIAEDDPATYLLLNDLLSTYGDVEHAIDGKVAVELVAKSFVDQTPYDLITMDIKMPKMNGHEAVEKIRRLETEYSEPDSLIKILMITVSNDSEDIKKSYRKGGQDYLVKPFVREDLEETLAVMGFHS